MSPGLRLLGAIAIILFLIVAGLLGGLQDLRMSIREDPALAAEVHAVSFPIPGIAGASPYKVMDLRERFQFASVYLANSNPPNDGVIMIVSRMPADNVDEESNLERGMNKEWKAGDFRRNGEPYQELLHFQGDVVYAKVQEFVSPGGLARTQIHLPLNWGGDRVFVQVNGPKSLVTMSVLRTALESVTGPAKPLRIEPDETSI
ncbi:MAG: hypothetical protein MK209_00580 [Planctomycetes bacterium]|nr:hypothetical protein [Planctomycetota bacterium]